MNIEGKKVSYITLGCKLNFSETSTIRHSLEAEGTISVDGESDADIYVINTCSVTNVAEKKGRNLIRKIASQNPGSYIVVVGCYAQLRAKEILNIEGVSAVLGAAEKFNVADYIKFNNDFNNREPHSCDVFGVKKFDLACSYGDRTRSFLKIQDGCNYFCSYCTIPYARGNSRSASIKDVLNTVETLSKKGIKEVILTGVNTGDFGNNKETFFDLVKALDNSDTVERFRISSIEPNLLTEEIIAFTSQSKCFMPHFHIPLQSGSDDVLRLMRRKYDTDLFANRVELIKKYSPDAFIGVDIIAGMKGETDEFFNQSYNFVKSLDISQLHVFPYSERSGTLAMKIPHNVSQEDKKLRVAKLISLSDEKKEQFYNKHIGTKRKVLFEDSKVGKYILGFTDNYIRVSHPYEKKLANRIIDVDLGELDENYNIKTKVICQ